MNIPIKQLIEGLKRVARFKRANKKPETIQLPCSLLILEPQDYADWREFTASRGRAPEEITEKPGNY